MARSSGPNQSMMVFATRLRFIGLIMASLAFVSIFAVPFIPIAGYVSDEAIARGASDLKPLPSGARQLQPLLAKMAGAPLIKPAQAKAAVKDDGTAQKLLAKLKLQGVIQMNGEMVAYVLLIDGKQTATVKRGDSLLEFVVQDIAPGQVKLLLQGVEVTLGH